MEFWLPYGTTEVPVAVPDENLLGFLSPVEDAAGQNPNEAIPAAVRYSIDGLTLLEAVKQGKKTVIAFNADSASSVMIADLLTKELVEANADSVHLVAGAADITQPKASRNLPQNVSEMPNLLPRHDPRTSAAAKVGQLEGGGDVLINETFASADVRCVVTNVSVNAFWGYSGGPSFVMSALSSEKTLKACVGPVVRSARLPGVLSGNHAYEAVFRAAQTVRIDLAVHAVESPEGKIAGVFVGGLLETFEQASILAGKIFRPTLQRKADIVISSAGGAPWDRSLSDASSAPIMATAACKDHGILVLVAECGEGMGALASTASIHRESAVRTQQPRRISTFERLVDYSIRRICGEHRTYLVSTLPEHQASLYSLLPAKSVGSALQRAIRHAGKDAKIAIIPYGCLTAPLVG